MFAALGERLTAATGAPMALEADDDAISADGGALAAAVEPLEHALRAIVADPLGSAALASVRRLHLAVADRAEVRRDGPTLAIRVARGYLDRPSGEDWRVRLERVL
jgi:hypothetical protein